MNYEDMLPYYYYVFNDNWLIFQDDADGESLRLMYLPSGWETQIDANRCYQPTFWGHYLYYRAADPVTEDMRIWRMNMQTGETESTKVLPAHSFFLSGRDILPENCIPVTLNDWQTATENPNREYEELYNYADESIVICTEYHEDSGIGKRVSIIHNGKGMVIPRTN